MNFVNMKSILSYFLFKKFIYLFLIYKFIIQKWKKKILNLAILIHPKNTKHTNKNINYSIELLRLILSFWVVLHHCLKNAYKIKGRFHVATFMIISFYYYYNTLKTKNVNKINQRFQRISIPYFVWPNFLYILNYLLIIKIDMILYFKIYLLIIIHIFIIIQFFGVGFRKKLINQ